MFKGIQLLFISVFIVIGAAMFLYSAWSGLRAYQSTAWREVPGTVLHAECRSANNRTSARHVQYEYAVGGVRYASEREHFGLHIATSGCVAGYGAGERVSVHYDPARPSEAVLLPGSYRQPAFGAAMGLAFAAFGGAAFWFGRKRGRVEGKTN